MKDKSNDQPNETLLRHAEILMASKVQRTKMIDSEHVNAFHESEEGKEFKEFCKTGIAAKISNLTSVYTMYLNTLDRQTDKKKQICSILNT